MIEVTRVRVETPVVHTVRVFEPQPVKVSVIIGSGSGGVTDHGALQGLGDNDHPQYALAADALDPADFATAGQGELADTAVQPAALTDEADTRAAADTALGGRIDDEAQARTDADAALSTDITNQVGNEATDRALADAALSDAIAAAISQEVADRTAAITAAIDALVGGAPGTLDTLVELAAALEGQMADLASLLTLIGTKETPAGAQAKVDIETGNRIAAVSAAIAAAAVDATTKADAAQAAAIAAAAVDATTKANAAVVTAAAAAQVIADAKVEDAIVNGVTTKAPSQNAVYDALALKATTAQGVLADTAVQPAAPATLTNKRITERWAVVAPGVTPALDTDLYDGFLLSGLAAAVTSMTTNLTGTPTQGQQFIAVLSDDGTARAITWDAKFTGSTLPTTTTVGSKTWVGCRWDTAANAFVCLATKVV